MPVVGLTPSFEKSLIRLTNQEQALVKQVPTDLMLGRDLPGNRLHPIQGAREKRFHSIRVSRDLRIIVLKEGERLLFCYVGHHDDAYRWAERRQLEVHPTTGAAQLVEFEEVIREEVRYVPRDVTLPPLFAQEDDRYLLSLGIPENWLPVVKEVDDEGLYTILDRLPEEAAESLVALATGERPELDEFPQADQLFDPFDHPDAKRRFWVATDERTLQQALEFPWERWMVFLHPSQRLAVERNFGGPARISGGAGTGKTVVALHRAAFSARLSEDARVYLSTYTTTLASRLSIGLNQLLGPDAPERKRITVEHLHKTAADMVRASGIEFTPLSNAELRHFLILAARAVGLRDVSPAFLRAEWDAVIDYWGVADWKAYRDIPRLGRGSALSPAKRRQIWPVFEFVRNAIREKKQMTWSDLCDAAREVLAADGTRPYRHVIIDEAQDFGPREIRFAMELAPMSSYSHFFTGDIGQRIYRYPYSWLRAGVDIRGRAARLHVNYRTTTQIERFADRLLASIDNSLDDEPEDRSSISLLSGPDPQIEGYATDEEETEALETWLRALAEEGLHAGEVAVFARTRDILTERAVPALDAAGFEHEFLSGTNLPDDDIAGVGTLHSAKGLEYRAVALIGCERGKIPLSAALSVADDNEARAIIESRERQLFYVGCTRARDILRISWVGMPSTFLD